MLNRRQFHQTAAATTAGLLLRSRGFAATGSRPVCEAIATGDATHNTAVVWAQCDRAASLVVEYSTQPVLSHARRARPAMAEADSDFTARVLLTELPPATQIHFRAWFQAADGGVSAPLDGSFRTAPAPGSRQDVFFAWSGDNVGQGFGINPEWGGLKIFEAIRRLHPQFFVHSGDHIYADVPVPPSIKLADGSTWTNVTTPAKDHPAVTLDDFRGNYKYNLVDDHFRRFLAEVPLVVQWDDHETTNNWYPQEEIAGRTDAAGYRDVKDVRSLAARARQAFFEYQPLPPDAVSRERVYRSIAYGSSAELFVLDQRTYRGPNTPNVQTTRDVEAAFLGDEQLNWLKESLRACKSTWKIICSDMPIGLIVADAVEKQRNFEAIANAEPGAPLGRELEFAELFRFLKAEKIRNVIWLTADVHYAAAHLYSPERAGFRDPFDPFWEFVAGPLHAGTFGPNKLDATFGPEVRFQWAPEAGRRLPNGQVIPPDFKLPLPPSAGMQSFGTVRIDALSQTLTVEFRDLNGELIHDGRQLGRIELLPV